MSSRRSPVQLIGLLVVVVRRPHLWSAAIRVGIRMVPDRWWTRRPFLPIPDRDYLRFRIVTAYGGDGSATIRAQDLVSYLEWCRRWWD